MEDIMGRPKKINTGTTKIKDKLLQLEKDKTDYLKNLEAKEKSIKKSYKADLNNKIKQKKVELKDLEKEYSNLYGEKVTRKNKTAKIKKTTGRGRPKKEIAYKQSASAKEEVTVVETNEIKTPIKTKANVTKKVNTTKAKNTNVKLTTEKTEINVKGKK
jgi:hypothetical protein